MWDLTKRVAVVTGGARGIGRGIALELARAGAAITIGSRHRDSSKTVAEEIRGMGGKALAVQLNVTDEESVTRGIAAAIECFGHVDILVNNAGIFQSRLGLELPGEDFNHCLDVNLTGMWRMVRALVPHFRERGGGRVINIASAVARQGAGIAPAYSASKAGVISLTQSLALALGGDNINVNAICPGAISTAMLDNIKVMKAQSLATSMRQRPAPPLPGPLTPEDIGRAVVFFASDYARHITGQTLNVDCGEQMN